MSAPTIDAICESILAHGAIEAREFAARAGEAPGGEWLVAVSLPYTMPGPSTASSVA